MLFSARGRRQVGESVQFLSAPSCLHILHLCFDLGSNYQCEEADHQSTCGISLNTYVFSRWFLKENKGKLSSCCQARYVLTQLVTNGSTFFRTMQLFSQINLRMYSLRLDIIDADSRPASTGFMYVPRQLNKNGGSTLEVLPVDRFGIKFRGYILHLPLTIV
jgi:hypothetical protein